MGNSESVKSVKSVVQFLWLRLAALQDLCLRPHPPKQELIGAAKKK
jgi:hypothetical protein